MSTNGKTIHIAIRFFFVHDRIKAREVVLEYKPTGDMVEGIMTKPLQGELFLKINIPKECEAQLEESVYLRSKSCTSCASDSFATREILTTQIQLERPHLAEQLSLQRLGHDTFNHVISRSIFKHHFSSLDAIMYKEEVDCNVDRLSICAHAFI
jgi:hypothetical protein